MTRVFAGMAASHLILLIATVSFGFLAKSVGQGRHVLLGILTVILSCLVQVAVFTYLTVTLKYALQVAHLGKLELDFVPRARAFKKTVTRLLGMVFLLNLLVTASGSAHWREGAYAWLHVLAGGATVVAHGVAYYLEFDIVYRNAGMVSSLLRRLERQRSHRHTPTVQAHGID